MPCIFRLSFMAENFAAPEAAMAESVKFVGPAIRIAKALLLPKSLKAFFYESGLNPAPKDPQPHRHDRVATAQQSPTAPSHYQP